MLEDYERDNNVDLESDENAVQALELECLKDLCSEDKAQEIVAQLHQPVDVSGKTRKGDAWTFREKAILGAALELAQDPNIDRSTEQTYEYLSSLVYTR
jgi:hypothetical protein